MFIDACLELDRIAKIFSSNNICGLFCISKGRTFPLLIGSAYIFMIIKRKTISLIAHGESSRGLGPFESPIGRFCNLLCKFIYAVIRTRRSTEAGLFGYRLEKSNFHVCVTIFKNN